MQTTTDSSESSLVSWVGQPFPAEKIPTPSTSRYVFNRYGHCLVLFLPEVTPAVDYFFAAGQFEFGLVPYKDVLLLMFKSIALSGSSCYSWWKGESVLPQPSALIARKPRADMNVLLVETETTLVRMLRIMRLSPDFTRQLHSAILSQASRQFPGESQLRSQVQAACQDWATPEDMMSAAVVRCVGS